MALKLKTKPAAPSAAQAPLHVRLRPSTLAGVVGQDAVVRSLQRALGKDSPSRPHAFLFTGPSGVGKTTLARIAANLLGIAPTEVMEIDAATNSGVEAMRQVTESVRYRSLMSDSGNKFVIVDECHALSKATWQSLLKPIEEPPAHVWWALCTTEADKVPETIRTRCAVYQLKAVGEDELADLLSNTVKTEGLSVPDELIGPITRAAQGSVRKALVALQQLAGVEDKREALRLLESGVGEEQAAIELARMVCTGKGFTWQAAVKVVAGLECQTELLPTRWFTT